jgi:hypothetical protein
MAVSVTIVVLGHVQNIDNKCQFLSMQMELARISHQDFGFYNHAVTLGAGLAAW